jgi:hypothetical protein
VEAKNSSVTSSTAFDSLLYQWLESELGCARVYEAALNCTLEEQPQKQWQQNLAQTRQHAQIVRDLLEEQGLAPDANVPARWSARVVTQGLLKAIEAARAGGNAREALLTAAECVVEAETKSHMNWEVVQILCASLDGKVKAALDPICQQIAAQGSQRLYRSSGWARELWLDALGLLAQLPPAEELKQVETATSAARVKMARVNEL